jgi:hypothetical protein
MKVVVVGRTWYLLGQEEEVIQLKRTELDRAVMFVVLVVENLEYIPSVEVAVPFPSAVVAAEVRRNRSYSPSVEAGIEGYIPFVEAAPFVVDGISGVLRVVRLDLAYRMLVGE